MSGDFEAGHLVELTLHFDSGDTITMDVPIVVACDAYDGLDPSSRSPPSRRVRRTRRLRVTCRPMAPR